MLRVGLTGGIGSGKSEVARRLAEHGAVLIDADVAARKVVEPGSPGLTQVAEAFGRRVRERMLPSQEVLARRLLAQSQELADLRRCTQRYHALLVALQEQLRDPARDDPALRPLALQLDMGLRLDWDKLVGRVTFSPRVAAAWSPFGSTRTRFTGGYAITEQVRRCQSPSCGYQPPARVLLHSCTSRSIGSQGQVIGTQRSETQLCRYVSISSVVAGRASASMPLSKPIR